MPLSGLSSKNITFSLLCVLAHSFPLWSAENPVKSVEPWVMAEPLDRIALQSYGVEPWLLFTSSRLEH